MGELELKEFEKICEKYKIKHKVFYGTNTIILDSGLDEWRIKYTSNKDMPYCLLHKNKSKQKNKFHTQRNLRTLYQAIDCVIRHKNILNKVYNF